MVRHFVIIFLDLLVQTEKYDVTGYPGVRSFTFIILVGGSCSVRFTRSLPSAVSLNCAITLSSDSTAMAPLHLSWWKRGSLWIISRTDKRPLRTAALIGSMLTQPLAMTETFSHRVGPAKAVLLVTPKTKNRQRAAQTRSGSSVLCFSNTLTAASLFQRHRKDFASSFRRPNCCSDQ